MKKKLLSIVLSIAMVVTMMPAQTLVVSAAAKTTATVSTQKGLKKAIKSKKLKTLTIKTSKKKSFSIPKGTHSNVDLILDAPKANVKNKSLFKTITIKNMLPSETQSGWVECKKGNTFIFEAAAGRMAVANGASVKEIRLTAPDTKMLFNVNGEINKINVEKKATLNFIGRTSETTTVNISKGADKTALTSSVEVSVYVEPNADIVLEKGAEGSEVIYGDAKSQVKVTNNTNGRVIASNAEGEQTLVKTTETFNSVVYEKEQAEKEAKAKEEQGQEQGSGQGTGGGTDPDPQKPSVKYTVKYVIDDDASWITGSTPATKTYTEGDIVALSDDYPVKYLSNGDELGFWGWHVTYLRSDGKVRDVDVTYENDFVMPAGNVTVKGMWEEAYCIEYREMSGSLIKKGLDKDAPTRHTYGEDTELLGASKTGSAFVGWTLEPDEDAEVVTMLDGYEFDDDITLYAKWAKLEELKGKVFYLTDEGYDCYDFYDKDGKLLDEYDMQNLYDNATQYAVTGYPKEDCVYMVATDKGKIICGDDITWADSVPAGEFDTAIGTGKTNTENLNKENGIGYWLNQLSNPELFIGSKNEVKEMSKILDDKQYWSSTYVGPDKASLSYDGTTSVDYYNSSHSVVAMVAMGESTKAFALNAKKEFEELEQRILSKVEDFSNYEQIERSLEDKIIYEINVRIDDFARAVNKDELENCKQFVNENLTRFEIYDLYLEQLQGIDESLESYALDPIYQFLNEGQAEKLKNGTAADKLADLLIQEMNNNNEAIKSTLSKKYSKKGELDWISEPLQTMLSSAYLTIEEYNQHPDEKFDSVVALRDFITKKYEQINGFVTFLVDNDLTDKVQERVKSLIDLTSKAINEYTLNQIMKNIKEPEISAINEAFRWYVDNPDGLLADILDSAQRIKEQSIKVINNTVDFSDIMLASELGQLKGNAINTLYTLLDTMKDTEEVLGPEIYEGIEEEVATPIEQLLTNISKAKDLDTMQEVIDEELKPIIKDVMRLFAEDARKTGKSILKQTASKNMLDKIITDIEKRIDDKVDACKNILGIMERDLGIELYLIEGVFLITSIIDTPITTSAESSLTAVYEKLPEIKDEKMDEAKPVFIALGKCIMTEKTVVVEEMYKNISSDAKDQIRNQLNTIEDIKDIENATTGYDAFMACLNKKAVLDAMATLMPKFEEVLEYAGDSIGTELKRQWGSVLEKVDTLANKTEFFDASMNALQVEIALMQVDCKARAMKIMANIKSANWDEDLQDVAIALYEEITDPVESASKEVSDAAELEEMWDLVKEKLIATEALSNIGGDRLCHEIAIEVGKLYTKSETVVNVNSTFFNELKSKIDELIENSADANIMTGSYKTSASSYINGLKQTIGNGISKADTYDEAVKAIAFPLLQVVKITTIFEGSKDKIWDMAPTEKLQEIMVEYIKKISQATTPDQLKEIMAEWSNKDKVVGHIYDRAEKIAVKADLFDSALADSIGSMMTKLDAELAEAVSSEDGEKIKLALSVSEDKVRLLEELILISDDEPDAGYQKIVSDVVDAVSADAEQGSYNKGASIVKASFVECVKTAYEEASAAASGDILVDKGDVDYTDKYKYEINKIKDNSQKIVGKDTLLEAKKMKDLEEYQLSVAADILEWLAEVEPEGEYIFSRDNLIGTVSKLANSSSIEDIEYMDFGDIVNPLRDNEMKKVTTSAEAIIKNFSEDKTKDMINEALSNYNSAVKEVWNHSISINVILSDRQLLKATNEAVLAELEKFDPSTPYDDPKVQTLTGFITTKAAELIYWKKK